MIDLPAGWVEKIQNIDWENIQKKVQDYGTLFEILRGTWTRESLSEMLHGYLFVPDDVMNDAIKKSIDEEDNLKTLTLTSRKDGKLAIAAETKSFGKVELTGELKEFVHQGDTSYAVYRVRERNLPGKGLASWIFSRISMSMASRMVGGFNVTDLPMEIHGNTIRVDYSKALSETAFGKADFEGHRLIDIIEIKKAEPREGGIVFQTELHIPDSLKESLEHILKGEKKPDGTPGEPKEEKPAEETNQTPATAPESTTSEPADSPENSEKTTKDVEESDVAKDASGGAKDTATGAPDGQQDEQKIATA